MSLRGSAYAAVLTGSISLCFCAGSLSQEAPSAKYTMPTQQQCAPIDNVVGALRSAKPTSAEMRQKLNKNLQAIQAFRAACHGALDFDSVSTQSAEGIVHDATALGPALPHYQSASFACVSDFEMCKHYYLETGSYMDANLSCGLHYLICTGSALKAH